MPFSNVSLNELEQHNDFIRRHIGPGRPEIQAMLDVVGAESLDDLMTQTVPASIRSEGLNVGEAFTLMYNLERVCKVQMSVLASGQPVQPIDSDVCELTYQQYKHFAEISQRGGFHAEWLAYLRLLEKVSPTYKE